MSNKNKKRKSFGNALKNIGIASLISLPLFFSGLNASAQTEKNSQKNLQQKVATYNVPSFGNLETEKGTIKLSGPRFYGNNYIFKPTQKTENNRLGLEVIPLSKKLINEGVLEYETQGGELKDFSSKVKYVPKKIPEEGKGSKVYLKTEAESSLGVHKPQIELSKEGNIVSGTSSFKSDISKDLRVAVFDNNSFSLDTTYYPYYSPQHNKDVKRGRALDFLLIPKNCSVNGSNSKGEVWIESGKGAYKLVLSEDSDLSKISEDSDLSKISEEEKRKIQRDSTIERKIRTKETNPKQSSKQKEKSEEISYKNIPENINDGRNIIYPTTPYITAHGNGYVLSKKVLIFPSNSGKYSLEDSLIHARKGTLDLRFVKPSKAIDNIEENLERKKELSSKEETFKNYLGELEDYVEGKSLKLSSLEKLNNSINNGNLIIDEKLSPKIKDKYAALEATSDKTGNLKPQTMYGFVHFNSPQKNFSKGQSTYGEKIARDTIQRADTVRTGESQSKIINPDYIKDNKERLKKIVKEQGTPGHVDTVMTSDMGCPQHEKKGEKTSPVRLNLGAGAKFDKRPGNFTQKYGNFVGDASLQFEVGNTWLGAFAGYDYNSTKQKVGKTDVSHQRELVNSTSQGDTYRIVDSLHTTIVKSSQSWALGIQGNIPLNESKTSELELKLGATKTNASRKIEGKKCTGYSKGGEVFGGDTLTATQGREFKGWTGNIEAGVKQYPTDSKNVSINVNAGYNFPLESTTSTFKGNFYGKIGLGWTIGSKK